MFSQLNVKCSHQHTVTAGVEVCKRYEGFVEKNDVK